MNTSPGRRRSMRLLAGLTAGSCLALVLGAAASPSSPHGSIASYPGELAGVSALSRSNAWAVGYRSTSSAYKALILRWNGSPWTKVTSPLPGRDSLLNDVTAQSPSDAWAVGSYETTSGGFRTLALHWNGTTWTQVPSPSPEVTDGSFLVSVTALSPSDAWAVGWYYLTGGEASNTLALHWDGTRWAVARSPNPLRGSFDVLNGVSALSASDAWAVGSYQNATGRQRNLILHWNGTSWATVASPKPGGIDDSYLSAVSVLSTSDAWAVGYYSTGSGQKNLILHWNGTRWTQVASPGPTGGALSGVSAVSPSDAWAVGNYVKDISNTLVDKTLVLHWNGAAWAVVASPDPGGATGTVLNGVSALSPADVWAVGSANSDSPQPKTLILHWNGARWTRS
jgi:hypothetical protein